MSVYDKPKTTATKSDYAVLSRYFYDNRVVDIAKNLKSLPGGELEITVKNIYLEMDELEAGVLCRETAWLDMSTFASIENSGGFVKVIEGRLCLKTSCIEKIAFEEAYIAVAQSKENTEPMHKFDYEKNLSSFE